MRPGSRPLILGKITVTQSELFVSAPEGSIAISGLSVEEVSAVLSKMNGRQQWGEILVSSPLGERDTEELLEALCQIGAVFDAREGWRLFHQLSRNPLHFTPRLRPEHAEALPRWEP